MSPPPSGIRCMLMRGGTSKGAFFLADDLPSDRAERDALLLAVMGSPDPRQIDGVGGAHPLTTKVAIVSPSTHEGADVDYLFLQVAVDRAEVTDRQNCGNMLAAVGPFALERGLIRAEDGETSVRIHMTNTGGSAVAGFPVRDGLPVYAGDTEISGVPGTAAEIRIAFEGITGSTTGALLPTGNAVDEIAGVDVTLVDNGMPVVVMRAADLGIGGYESCEDLEANRDLRHRLEDIRLQAGPMMGMGDVADATVPKLTLVAPPRTGGAVSTRTFIPHRCHQAIGVLGAVSVATACLLAGSPAAELAHIDGDVIRLEHPTGSFDVVVRLELSDPPLVREAGIVRTARKLMDGYVFPRQY